MSPNDNGLLRGVIDAWIKIFQSQKQMADAAVAQLSDEQLHRTIADGTNSVAVILNHMAGNMTSRWADWLTTDGEKPGRNREHEFQPRHEPRAALITRWDAAWALVFNALRELSPEDLGRTVTIRGEPHSVPDAVNRQISHYGYHVGQIMLIARIIRGNQNWNWLTVAPGGTAAFNHSMKRRHGDWEKPGSTEPATERAASQSLRPAAE